MTYKISYGEMQELYKNFQKNPPQDAFERYAEQLNHVRSLIQGAKLQGLKEDVFEYQKAEKEALVKLREMGYNII